MTMSLIEFPRKQDWHKECSYVCTNSVDHSALTPQPLIFPTMSSNIKLLVKKLSQHATLPTRGSAGAAGYDLSSAKDVLVPARGKALCPTDLSIALPNSVYGRIAARSGLAWKHSIDTGAGVIDEDVRKQ